MKVALVTGASRGLGAAIARTLAADGWAVAVNCRSDIDGARAVVDDIRGRGGAATVAAFDITDKGAIETGLSQIADDLGPVDLLVNNATGPQPERSIDAQTWDDYETQLAFFVKAPLLLLQACLPDWRSRGSGRVVNIGSEAARTGPADMAHYATAKSAMTGMTRAWATELGADGITVNIVEPGFTPVERHAGLDDAIERYRETVPLGRMARPDDIAGAVAFLASTRADFISGQRIPVNGARRFV